MVKLKILPLILLFFATGCNIPYFSKQISQLQVFSDPKTMVYIDGNSYGTTPLISDDLKEGRYQIKLATDSASWIGQVKLNPGTITIVNRHLTSAEGEGQTGEVLELSKGEGVVVVSQPDKSKIKLGDKDFGVTPIAIEEVSAGDHRIEVSHDGYISRAIQIQVHQGYVTTVSVELAKQKAKEEEKSSDNDIVRIIETPTSWLRVRSGPSLAEPEISRVNTGEKHTLLQEEPGWYKIRLPDKREGWISAQYAQKI